MQNTTSRSPGTTWVTKIDGKPWPCIILDQEKVELPGSFLENKRREQAVPVLVMGRWTLRWCKDTELKEFVPSADYLGDDGKAKDLAERPAVDLLRKKGFDEASEWHPMDYFQSIIAVNQAEQGGIDEEEEMGSINQVRDKQGGNASKRAPVQSKVHEEDIDQIQIPKSTQRSCAPFVEDSTDDEEVDHNGDHIGDGGSPTLSNVKQKPTSPTPKTAMPTIRVSSSSRGDKNGLKDIRKPDSRKPPAKETRKRTTLKLGIVNPGRLKMMNASTSAHPAKRPKFRHAGYKDNMSMEEIDDLRPLDISSVRQTTKPGLDCGGSIATSGSIRTADKLPASMAHKAAKLALDSDKRDASSITVKIYLDQGINEYFWESNMAMVNKCRHFKDNLMYEAGLPCVRSRELSLLKRSEFEPITEYLETQDYEPRLIEGDHPRLLGVNSVGQHEEAALKAGYMWNRAKELGLGDLMPLVRRKIDAQWPLACEVLLLFTRLVFFSKDSGHESEKSMRILLKEEIANRFYELLIDESMLLSKVMRADEEIVAAIVKVFSENPAQGGRVNLSEED